MEIFKTAQHSYTIKVGQKYPNVSLPTEKRALIKTYKSNPGDFTAAANAAYHYATKDKVDIYLIPHASYGRRVYHVIYSNYRKQIGKYVVSAMMGAITEMVIAVVTAKGELKKATITKSER